MNQVDRGSIYQVVYQGLMTETTRGFLLNSFYFRPCTRRLIQLQVHLYEGTACLTMLSS